MRFRDLKHSIGIFSRQTVYSILLDGFQRFVIERRYIVFFGKVQITMVDYLLISFAFDSGAIYKARDRPFRRLPMSWEILIL